MQAFCAYPGQPPAIGQIFSNANVAPGIPGLNLHLWPENDICGRPLIDPIFENIEASDALIADVTYPNFNVFFEIGYAIGLGKKVLLTVNGGLKRDRSLIASIGILDSIGYENYENSEQLKAALELINTRNILYNEKRKNLKSPIYVIEFNKQVEFLTLILSRVKKSRLRYRSFNPSEHIRLSAREAIDQVSSSSGVIIPLAASHYENYLEHNFRCAFVAGLSRGFGKPTLLLQEVGGPVPLDVIDFAQQVRHPETVSDLIAEFIPQVTAELTADEEKFSSQISPLADLYIGDPMAENEMTTLRDYYIQIDQFQRTLRGEADLVVGRKGMGKTALFTQIRDSIRSKVSNVVIDLKPEGYQLIRLKEDVINFLSIGSQDYLITALWEYLLYLEICYKVLEKDKEKHTRDRNLYEPYNNLRDLYEVEEVSEEADFSERLLRLSERIRQEFMARFKGQSDIRISAGDLTEILYIHDLQKIRTALIEYLKHKDEVWILFDNLDKGWPAQGISPQDIKIIRCLIEAAKKIRREFSKRSIDCFSVIFIRNDVYENLIEQSSDFGKDMRVSLDWDDPELLKAVVLRRISSNKIPIERFDTAWSKIFKLHYRGEHSFYFLLDHSLMRPRNLIKLISHCRGYAVNRGHSTIDESDIDAALATYSNDILIEADREIFDIAPEAKDVMYSFIGCKKYLSESELNKAILLNSNIDNSAIEKIKYFMLYFGFIGFVNRDREIEYIYNNHYNMKLLLGKVRSLGDKLSYAINPAFWPALSVTN